MDVHPKFIDTINPLLSFSNDDLEAMNEDVNEIFESNSSSDDSDNDIGMNREMFGHKVTVLFKQKIISFH